MMQQVANGGGGGGDERWSTNVSPAVRQVMQSNADPALILQLIRLIGGAGPPPEPSPPALITQPTHDPGHGPVVVDVGVHTHPSQQPQQQTRSGRISRPADSSEHLNHHHSRQPPPHMPPQANQIDSAALSGIAILQNLLSGNLGQQAPMRQMQSPQDRYRSPPYDRNDGDPGPSTSAARKRRRSRSPSPLPQMSRRPPDHVVRPQQQHPQHQQASRAGWEHRPDHRPQPQHYAVTDNEFGDDMMSDGEDDGGDSQDEDGDGEERFGANGEPLPKRKRGKPKRLDPEEALRRRKERNKKAAQISRDRKKLDFQAMEVRVKELETEQAELTDKYNALEQQHNKLKEEHAALQESMKSRPAAQQSSRRNRLIQENTITINGIPLNLDQYLALNSRRPRNRVTQAVAQQMGVSPNSMDDEDDEEDDVDFLPSSPVHDGETPQSDVTDEQEEDTTPRASRLSSGGRSGDGEPGEFVAQNEDGDQEDYEDDDEHFEDDDMDDEELFLPIEDVPVPEGEQEAIQAAYHQPANSNLALLQQLERVVGPNSSSSASDAAAMQAALLVAGLGGKGSLLPEPPLPPAPAPAPAPALAPAPTTPAPDGNSTAKQLLEAYAAIGGSPNGPDRGYGLGRGEQRDQDPAALMRQLMILLQSQQNQQQQGH